VIIVTVFDEDGLRLGATMPFITPAEAFADATPEIGWWGWSYRCFGSHAAASLFDHLVGAGEERRRHGEAKRRRY